jgi:glycosyltransferase involved in cell wall biosynthesis
MYASVVIPTYNRRKTLARTLDGIISQTAANDTYEIIVVDDQSTDDTQTYMISMLEVVPNLVYLRHDKNQGRVVTRNDGIRAARGDIVIFLDDDNWPDSNFVEAHRGYHERSNERHLVVMGNAQYAPIAIQGSNFGKYLQSRYLGCRTPKERSRLDYTNLPPHCLGTLNCSVRRSDLLALGLLDTSFIYYGGEDGYLGYGLTRLGARITFGEEARTLHYDDVSIARYKLKLLETARFGLRTIMDKSPDYVEDTQVRFLLPIDWQKDSPIRIVVKASIWALLNPLTTFLFERWAVLTDRFSRIYFSPLYRLLLAAWILQGYRSKMRSVPLVTYGEENQIP